jgi:site-specific DNA-methyltransferase (adenine-specific)
MTLRAPNLSTAPDWQGQSRQAVIVQDCLAGMREHLAPGSVDAVVTSPPYNLGIAYSQHDDTAPRADYLDWCDRWAREVQRILAPGGSFFLNVDGSCKDPWVPFEVAAVMRRHFVLQNRIAWVKSMSDDLEAGAPVEGHVKPISGERFLNKGWEFLLHFTHRGEVPLERVAVGVQYADLANLGRGTRGKHGNRRCAGDVWHLPYETIQRRSSDRPHPATFPVALAERCIRLHGLSRTRLVADPFLGLGSTLVAAARLGVPGIGFEIDPEYARLAQLRIAEVQL